MSPKHELVKVVEIPKGSDRWHDQNIQRRWAAEDRIREINREFDRREDRRMEEEREERHQAQAARERREQYEREQAEYEWEMNQHRLQEELEQDPELGEPGEVEVNANEMQISKSSGEK